MADLPVAAIRKGRAHDLNHLDSQWSCKWQNIPDAAIDPVRMAAAHR
jgi:hypothetical protein